MRAGNNPDDPGPSGLGETATGAFSIWPQKAAAYTDIGPAIPWRER